MKYFAVITFLAAVASGDEYTFVDLVHDALGGALEGALEGAFEGFLEGIADAISKPG